VYNDSSFSEADIKGIQCLGIGSKGDDPTKTGRLETLKSNFLQTPLLFRVKKFSMLVRIRMFSVEV
jgi:hypothetical protein